MVDKNDVKYFKSASGVGLGRIVGSTEIISATPNNVYDDITPTELSVGRTEYRCIYVKNEHDTETMKDVHLWLQTDNPQTENAIAQWALDPISQGYDQSTALLFDGTDDYIECGNHADLWSGTLTKFSFCLWIFPTAAGDGNFRRVVQHNGGSAQGFELYIDNTNSTVISFNIRDSGGAAHIASSDQLTLNAWNFIVCTYDNTLGSDNIKIYVDSVLGNFNDGVNQDLTQSITLSATLRLSDSSTDFKGHWSGFSFFKSIALSQADIIRAYETDYLAEKQDPDYLLYMDEMTGTSLDDEQSAKTGTINGAVWSDAIETPNTTTAPVGIVQWYGVTNGPVSNTPNIGDIRPNQSVPFWVKWTVAAGSEDAKDDYCIFVVEGKIPEEATAPTTPNQGESEPPQTPTSVPNFTFANCGDWDGNSRTDDVVSLIKSWNPKVVVSGGDCAYDCGESDFFSAIKPIDDNAGSGRPRFETAFGNHDNDESECDDNEDDLKSHFKYSNTYHHFAYENIEFIFIDNSGATDFSKGSSQYNAVKGWLEAASKNGKIFWKIVVAHVAPWGASSKHDYNEEDFTEIYQPLFDTHKVDLFLAAHNHMWCQCEPAKYNSSSPTNPKVTQNGGGPYTKGNGTVVTICGTGGHDSVSNLYSSGSTSFTNYANNDHLGALRFDVSNNGKTITGKFTDIDGGTEKTFVING